MENLNRQTKSVLIHAKDEIEIRKIVDILTNSDVKELLSKDNNEKTKGIKEILCLILYFRKNEWDCCLTTLSWINAEELNIKILMVHDSSIEELNKNVLNRRINLIIARRLGSVERERIKLKIYMESLEEIFKGIVINPPKTVIYALDKSHYIKFLCDKGFNIPQTYCKDNNISYNSLLEEFPDSDNWIIKPTTGECGNSVSILSKTNSDFFDTKNPQVGGWLVQRKIDDICNGEIQIVFIGNRFSHAWQKEYQGALTQYGVYRQNDEDLRFENYTPTKKELSECEKIIGTLKEIGIDIHIGRIDFIKGSSNTLLEVEMINPEIDTDSDRVSSIVTEIINLSDSLC